MRKYDSRATRKAFTLVELLVVVVLIAILAAIAVPKFMNSGQRGREAALKADLKLYRNAIELFHNDTGLFPATLDDLAATSAATTNAIDATGTPGTITTGTWNGPYLYAVVPDPTPDSLNAGGAPDPWNYSNTTAPIGPVHSANPTIGLDGTAYDLW